MIRLLISRDPPELKIVLLQASIHSLDSWQQFIKITEENLWVAFPEHHLTTISTASPIVLNSKKNQMNFTFKPNNTDDRFGRQWYKNNKNKNVFEKKQKKFCLLHDWCSHS
ncbi:hypothetical protein COBT_004275, partial [Conglomerata obtusa]